MIKFIDFIILSFSHTSELMLAKAHAEAEAWTKGKSKLSAATSKVVFCFFECFHLVSRSQFFITTLSVQLLFCVQLFSFESLTMLLECML